MSPLNSKLRISLRTILLATGGLAIWIGWNTEFARRQSRVAEWAASHKGTVTYDRFFELVDKDRVLFEDREQRSWYVPQRLRERLGENLLSSITSVSVQNAELMDIKPLAQLGSLESVTFHNNNLKGIEPLKGVEISSVAILSENQIDDITALAGMTNLKKIDLRSNQVRDLSPLKSLKELLSLDLTENRVVDLSPIEGLTNLRELGLRRNPISDVTPLLALRALRILDMRETGLNDSQIQRLKDALPNARIIVE